MRNRGTLLDRVPNVIFYIRSSLAHDSSAISTVAFFCLRRMWRIGQATSAESARGGDLVKQRLETMMVLPVDHGDLDRRAA